MTFRMTPEDAQRLAALEENDVVGAGNKSLAQAIVSVFGVSRLPEKKLFLATEETMAGTVVAVGTPEEIAQCEQSHTGRYLKKLV